jgi:hypothetical protein
MSIFYLGALCIHPNDFVFVCYCVVPKYVGVVNTDKVYIYRTINNTTTQAG